MNKRGQVAEVASSVVSVPIVQWVGVIIFFVLVGYVVAKLSPDAASIMFFFGALLFYAFVFLIFAYFWYWVGKWLYYIIVHAKSFIQNGVNWVLAVFE